LRRKFITGLVALTAALGTSAAISAASAATATTAATAVTRLPATAIPIAPALTAGRGLFATHPVPRPDFRAATTAADNVLGGVSCKHDKDCLAVGQNFTGNGGFGSPLAYLWNGKAWRATAIHLPSGAKGGGLGGVSCTSGGCMATGFYRKGNSDFPLAEFWDGNKWVLPAQPAAVAGANYHALESVSCITAVSCVATGFYVPASNSNDEIALAETWNGHSWKAFKPPIPTKTPLSALNSVTCPTTRFCLAGGAYFDPANNGEPLLADSWDGKAWHRVTVAQPTLTNGWANLILGVSCRSSTSCTAVGATRLLQGNSVTLAAFAEVLSGSTWTLTDVPMPASQQSALFSASCTSPTACVATGGVGPLRTDNDAHAASAVWNGFEWKVKVLTPPAGQGSAFIGTTCITATNCVAVGTQGKFNTLTGHGLTGFWNGIKWRAITTA
jgi:hypothetical protein